MKKDHPGISTAAKPSGDGCVECLAAGGLVASPPSMRAVWAHRVLRQFSKPTCDKTPRINGTYCGCQLRTG